MNKVSREVIDACHNLARLIFAFGRVERATHHEDGVRKETDADHTVMLGIMACAYAKEFAPHLDIGKIAQFALVHDLVEAYAGDVNTYGLTSTDAQTEKEEGEAAALARIKQEFDSVFPWIAKTIEEYESLESSEARFVKVFDKVLPKIVHTLNNGASVRSFGGTKEKTISFHTHQFEKLQNSYGSDQSEAMALLQAVIDECHEKVVY